MHFPSTIKQSQPSSDQAYLLYQSSTTSESPSSKSKPSLLPFYLSKQHAVTIGRTSKNHFQIYHSAVSRDHAVIQYLRTKNQYVLQDLGSVNGTHVNEEHLIGGKKVLRHNDQIMFGKCDQVYVFHQSKPQPSKKGTINFKDYHFELDDQNQASSIVVVEKKKSPSVGQRKLIKPNNSPPKKDNKQTRENNRKEEQSKFSPTKGKFQRGAIKIPNFQDFLELEDVGDDEDKGNKNNENSNISLIRPQSSNITKPTPDNNYHSTTQQTKSHQPQPQPQPQSQHKIKLPELNNQDLSEEQSLIKRMIERKKELEKIEKQAQLARAQEQQRALEARLKMEIQKAQQQEAILQRQYQVERNMKKQQEQIRKQKQMLEKKKQLNEQQLEQRQQSMSETLKAQEANLMQQMKRQKEEQLLKLKDRQAQIIKELEIQKNQEVLSIKQRETQLRIQNEQKFKEQLDRKKHDLENEAEALARQYETIYKDTIKKLKLNIETEKDKISQLETNIKKIDKQNSELKQDVEQSQLTANQLKSQFYESNGRNKAFLLYASHLQSQIDQLRIAEQQTVYSTGFNKTSKQLKDSIFNSRKLIAMKQAERIQNQSKLKDLYLELSTATGTSTSTATSEQYLNTVMDNYQTIQQLKDIYFEYMEQEKIMQKKWDLQLQQNTALEEKCRNSVKQMQNNKKKLNESLLDNLKKLTEQRVHMLKMMHYASEQKKRAAKFLVEEMLGIEQQTKSIFLDNENTHTKITDTILIMQQLKKQSQFLSEILFGNDSTSHHFDNMKQEINRLMDCIALEGENNRIGTYLKASEQVKSLQRRIYEQYRREKKLKGDIKNHGHVIPALNTGKNPLVFFGGLLMKKQLQMKKANEQQKELEVIFAKMLRKMFHSSDLKSLLFKKRSPNQINQWIVHFCLNIFLDYKRSQLQKVKQYMYVK